MPPAKTNSPDASVFSLRGVWFSFPNANAPLFRDLSLEIREGETFAILGPSGEGKSTLLKVMAGLLSPQRGSVEFRGQDLGRLSRTARAELRRTVGMTFQKSGLFDSLTCGENLHFPLREIAGMKTAEREPKVRRALEEVGLAGIEDLTIEEVSGGMQKRLGIARSLILSPKVVLFDDPTAGLDPITSRAIMSLILDVKAKYKMTTVVVSNDVRQTYRIADRIGFLHEGTFLRIGTAEEIRNSEDPAVEQFLHGLLEGPLTGEGGANDRV